MNEKSENLSLRNIWQLPKESEGTAQQESERTDFQAKETANVKILKQECSRHYQGTARKPLQVQSSDQGEEGGDEVREVVGARCQGLVGTMKNLGLFCAMQATGDL